MKKIFLLLAFCFSFGLAEAQNFALSWNPLRILDPLGSTIYIGGEMALPKSEKKTLQVSVGFGNWANWLEGSFSDFRISPSTTFRYGIEQKYFLEELWQGEYVSAAFEVRTTHRYVDRWQNICETGNCYQQIITEKQIRNTFNLIGRFGTIERIGKHLYLDLFIGGGLKVSRKEGGRTALEDGYFQIDDNNFFYPSFSLGFRVGAFIN